MSQRDKERESAADRARDHCAQYRAALEAKLKPLIVPPGCGFRVGDTVRECREGEAFVFDDTIEHEAWNDSDELRVVLIFDVWAPALSAAERAAVAAIIPAAGVGFTGAL